MLSQIDGVLTGRAATLHRSVTVYGQCAVLRVSVLTLSELKIQLQPETDLLQTPVVENSRKIGHLAPLSFYYMHLHQQCDSLLLMGGVGVEHCARPSLPQSQLPSMGQEESPSCELCAWQSVDSELLEGTL